jgi:hypothetical protein
MKRAGDFLTAIIDADLLKKATTYSGFFSSWAEIAAGCGIAAVAGYSRVREFEKGIIVVEADHPGWIQLLQTKTQWILKDARRRFPDLDIRGISFTLSKPDAPPRADSPPKADAPGSPGPAVAERAAPEASPPENAAPGEKTPSGGTPWERIEDGDFKTSLKRLERSIKEREKRKP